MTKQRNGEWLGNMNFRDAPNTCFLCKYWSMGYKEEGEGYCQHSDVQSPDSGYDSTSAKDTCDAWESKK